MFWQAKQKSSNGVIHFERSSVCMGDDCTAPNPSDISFNQNETLVDLLCYAYQYVPAMKNSVWAVLDNKQLLGIVCIGENGEFSYELVVENRDLSYLDQKKIFCRYFYMGMLKDDEKSLAQYVKDYYK